MKTKNRKAKDFSQGASEGSHPQHESAGDTLGAPQESGKDTPPDSSSGNGNQRERFQLSFDLLPDGSPDLSQMRDKTKERVRQFLSDPGMARAFGISTPVTPQIMSDLFPCAPAVIDEKTGDVIRPAERYPAIIGGMYTTLGTIEALCAERFGKIPAQIAQKVFTYSEQEKELLANPTKKVLNKWAPLWLIKYQDELALAQLLVGITVAKVQACLTIVKLQSQMKTTPEGPKPPEGVTAQSN